MKGKKKDYIKIKISHIKYYGTVYQNSAYFIGSLYQTSISTDKLMKIFDGSCL